MNFQKIGEWFTKNRDLSFEVLRIYLGIALLVKGFFFLENTNQVVEVLGASRISFVAVFIAHYVVSAHLVGGALLAMGLATRFSALIQLPALLGAIFFVYLPEGLFTQQQSLELVILVAMLLIAYSIYGSGRISVDHYLFTHPEVEGEQPRRRHKKVATSHI